MATYAIGDIQGCFKALQNLLSQIHFNENEDSLWFTGDLVNRGPESLKTLRFIKNLKGTHHTVLGNHDLHLLAVANHPHKIHAEDTFTDILTAPDKEELLSWLSKQPLLYYDDNNQYALVHAGIAPQWNLAEALALAHEVSEILQSAKAPDFLENMYGNFPNQWHNALQGFERYRCITNYFTRARFCNMDGSLELSTKGKLTSSHLIPWFKVQERKTKTINIIFGHWAALAGNTQTPHVFALDTGCVWGYALTALCLESGKRFSVPCNKVK